jgi:hypothetical protein
MKSAKIALVAAFVMAVLNSGSCLGLLFFDARHVSPETNHAFPKTEEMQSDILNQMQAGLQQMQAAQQEQIIHHYQMALDGEIAALAWNLLLAGLLIFAISRIQKAN